jgi:hypothetical protein
MGPFETYITELRDIRSSGSAVKETSFYGALSTLLNDLGKTLKPRVRCIINIKNQGAGIPDGGLFTPDQFQRPSEAEPLPGQLPSRGAIEIKGTGDEVFVVAGSAQVGRYLERYRQVLVTNYRDFVLVGYDAERKPTKLETYSLGASEPEFWSAAVHPHRLAERHAERFTEYLKRVMLHAAPLAAPKDVAWFLASYARDARARIESQELPALAAVRSALEEALGIKFEGKRGDHFFRSTLVQTLFYGVFSAWVLWSKQHPPTDRKARFDWYSSARYLRVPILRKMFHELAEPGQMDAMRLSEVLDWAGVALNRVDRAAFFGAFKEAHAVQYFYEPFLEAFDPALRKELGVWYTPPEIVEYMVARVDTILRHELDIEDGLADPRVYVLDPCCGTGAFLVEVLKRIDRTTRERGVDALTGSDLKQAAIERVFGFEILPAPFVVSHLQIGLLLQNLGSELSESENERVSVFLTNALTGWEPPKGPKQHLLFKELEDERDAAEHVKREAPILVILGNPPYNAFAGVSPEEEQGLVEPYKKGLISEWGIKKFNLDDLYVRFFRLAERRIAEKTGRGVVCYISNFSYLSDASFVVMRRRFLQEFDKLWFDCMNGDSRETGKLTPEGKPDPSIFSTEYNREGIRLGTAIGLMVRNSHRSRTPTVNYREFWGESKRNDLLESLVDSAASPKYDVADPNAANRFSFRLSTTASDYALWPRLTDLCAEAPISGLQEMRKGSLMSMDSPTLRARMRAYYDPDIEWSALRLLAPGLTVDGGRFNARAARVKVMAAEKYSDANIQRYSLYPFDTRWCYHSKVRPLWNEPRPALSGQRWDGNSFIVTRMMAERPKERIAVTYTSCLPDYHLLRPNAVAIPMRLRRLKHASDDAGQDGLFSEPVPAGLSPIANLCAAARRYLKTVQAEDPDKDAETASTVWMHALAIGYSPSYLAENGNGIRSDWPRIPLPETAELLGRSAVLGQQIARLLDTERPVAGVTPGATRQDLSQIAVISRTGAGDINVAAGELAVTAGWGHGGKDGVTMPGKGLIRARDYTPDEKALISVGATESGLTAERAIQCLGETTLDVYLNGVAYWRNVPLSVWEYTVGGYQVIKKWLSYRERPLLGRDLNKDEAREVTNIARRIAAILLMEPALDENYRAIKNAAFDWQCGQGSGNSLTQLPRVAATNQVS